MRLEYSREYYKKNKANIQERQRIYYKLNYQRRKERNRDFRLRREFGLPLGEYKKMFLNQQGCCAICEAPQHTKISLFAVDHNHITGQNRGLLCLNCNAALGQANESVATLEKMIAYLRKFDAQIV